MKKYISMILVIIGTLFMVACGDTKDGGGGIFSNESAVTFRVTGSMNYESWGLEGRDVLEIWEVLQFKDNIFQARSYYYVFATEEAAKEYYDKYKDKSNMVMEKTVVGRINQEIYFEEEGQTREDMLVGERVLMAGLEYEFKDGEIIPIYKEGECTPIEECEEIISSHLQPLTLHGTFEPLQRGVKEKYQSFYFDNNGHVNRVERYQIYESEEMAKERFEYEKNSMGDANVSLEGAILYWNNDEAELERVQEHLTLRREIKQNGAWVLGSTTCESFDGVVTP